jgi:hypothetical protein
VMDSEHHFFSANDTYAPSFFSSFLLSYSLPSHSSPAHTPLFPPTNHAPNTSAYPLLPRYMQRRSPRSHNTEPQGTAVQTSTAHYFQQSVSAAAVHPGHRLGRSASSSPSISAMPAECATMWTGRTAEEDGTVGVGERR